MLLGGDFVWLKKGQHKEKNIYRVKHWKTNEGKCCISSFHWPTSDQVFQRLIFCVSIAVLFFLLHDFWEFMHFTLHKINDKNDVAEFHI